MSASYAVMHLIPRFWESTISKLSGFSLSILLKIIIITTVIVTVVILYDQFHDNCFSIFIYLLGNRTSFMYFDSKYNTVIFFLKTR